MSDIPENDATPESAPEPSEDLRADEVLYPDDQPAPETETSDQKAEDQTEKPESSADEAEGYDLKMPEGVDLDPELLKEATPTLRELGLSNVQANRLVPLVTKIQDRLLDAQNDNFATLRAVWAREAKGDREIGGEHWKDTIRLSGVALEAGGAKSLKHEARALLEGSGLGNHPTMLRLFRRMGAEIDRLRKQAGVSRGPRPASREEALYPDDVPKR
jgi:hypothetical protein